ncbi:methionyl-tRNA formyltransferase [Limisalsivibrio acetivorans]|uniref:methionyl-tRNA formyltransferase n=1 Tax=Limisalsivibrio acetivorans TaxID=1304888 RepID=UPI0003B4B96B|nr:formyltransferase family protein [Limisalsivibrio acetivorans]
MTKVLLVGDSFGVSQLMELIPVESICGIVGASVRPRYINELEELSAQSNAQLIIQPKYNTPDYTEFSRRVQECGADVLICNSYSMLIRGDILELFGGRAYNVHYALLPLNRGPNPVQWAIIRDESVTGVTIHRMSEGFDEGEIISSAREEIRETDTWVSLNERLKQRAFDLLSRTVPALLREKPEGTKQDDSRATKNPRLTPDYPCIDFDSMTDRGIFNLIRAQVKPLRGAYYEKEGERVYVDCYLSMEEVGRLRKDRERG